MLILNLSCASNGQETKPDVIETVKLTPIKVDTACDWVKAIWISKSDTLTPETARQIYNHNESVKAACHD